MFLPLRGRVWADQRYLLSLAPRLDVRRRWLRAVRAFPPTPETAAAARGFLREVADLPADVLADVLLLTTELVTNAIRHADHRPGDQIQVTVFEGAGSFKVSVRNRGAGFDARAPHVRTEEGGWGLRVVGTVARRWGVEVDRGTTEVWFEIDPRPDTAPPAEGG